MTTQLIHSELIAYLRQNEWLTLNGYLPKYHAVLSDPPYFLGSIVKRFGGKNAAPAKFGKDGAFSRTSKGFMGATWDGFDSPEHYQAWCTEWASLLLSYVYPGALGMFFGGTRTYHRLAAGLEDAGWEVIDCVGVPFCYGSGFPKSHSVDDYGSALKPAWEPCVIVRAPRGKHTFAELYQRYGTGLFNIDGGRIGTKEMINSAGSLGKYGIYGGMERNDTTTTALGRYPANLILDEYSAAAMDAMSGDRKAGNSLSGNEPSAPAAHAIYGNWKRTDWEGYGDTGGASRFFYTAKASAFERECGLTARCTHPTIKPITLTEYLARLLLPPSHISERRLLIPFAGVASEMIGAKLAGWDSVTGVEMTDEYISQAQARLDWWSQFSSYEQAKRAYEGETANAALESAGQLSLFAESEAPNGTR